MYPSIRDKSCKGFQDRMVKSNCQKKVCEELNCSVPDAEQQYKTMQTAFLRYLSKMMGKSVARNDLGTIDKKVEHMRWLISFIKSRQSCSNVSPIIARPQQDDEYSAGVACTEPRKIEKCAGKSSSFDDLN